MATSLPPYIIALTALLTVIQRFSPDKVVRSLELDTHVFWEAFVVFCDCAFSTKTCTNHTTL